MQLHGEKLAGERRGEDVPLGGGEGAVGDDGEAGDTAQEVSHGQTGEQWGAVVVQSSCPPQHHQGQAVTNRSWGGNDSVSDICSIIWVRMSYRIILCFVFIRLCQLS